MNTSKLRMEWWNLRQDIAAAQADQSKGSDEWIKLINRVIKNDSKLKVTVKPYMKDAVIEGFRRTPTSFGYDYFSSLYYRIYGWIGNCKTRLENEAYSELFYITEGKMAQIVAEEKRVTKTSRTAVMQPSLGI
ncbi:MAG: hypothetical protein V1652_03820 [bacterium]